MEIKGSGRRWAKEGKRRRSRGRDLRSSGGCLDRWEAGRREEGLSADAGVGDAGSVGSGRKQTEGARFRGALGGRYELGCGQCTGRVESGGSSERAREGTTEGGES